MEKGGRKTEEKNKEKLRLQELLKQFARDALIGVDCQILLLSDKQRTQAKFAQRNGKKVKRH